MRNPLRRSKNIGKTQGGRVRSGRATEKWSRVFSQGVWEQLSDLLSESDGQLHLLRENPSRGFYHPCTTDEYVEVLSQLPDDLTRYLKAIVLRRTSKRDARLGVEARRRYQCILMNSFPTTRRMMWGSHPPSERTVRHYAPWCASWRTVEGKWVLEWSEAEIRRYYLFHLFLHELGHINQPSFHELKRREDFAEGFALEWARKLGVLQ
jgi:hypothetical protein